MSYMFLKHGKMGYFHVLKAENNIKVKKNLRIAMPVAVVTSQIGCTGNGDADLPNHHCTKTYFNKLIFKIFYKQPFR